jgi:clan AA aspartic protease (TIGR02281 family)
LYKFFFNFLIILFISAPLNAQPGIKMEKKNGVFYIPCKINGLELQFILDTGASDVTISKSESMFMLKNGYLDSSDLLDKQYYEMADGNIAEGTKLNIRRLEIGDIVLENVAASVVHTQASPLLLGQSVLERFDEIKIDYNRRLLFLLMKETIHKPITKIFSKEELLSKIEESSERIIDNPKNTDAWLDMAKSKLALGENESAIKDLNRVLEIDANHVEAYYQRGQILALTNKKQKAIYDFSQAIALSPHHAESFYSRGLLKIQGKDFEGAALDFDKAISLSPNPTIDMLRQRADVKFELKRFQEAIKDFNAIIALESNKNNLADIHYYLGLSKKGLKDYQGAFAEFSRAHELNDKKIDYLINKADVLVLLQDYKNALKDFTAIIDNHPTDIALYFRRAHLKTLLKDYRGALSDYETIQSLDKNDVSVFEFKAEIYYAMNNFEEALTNYNVALTLKNENLDLLIAKGNTLTQLKRYQEAIEVYNQVIKLNPKDVDAYTKRGLAFFQLDQMQAACLDWSRAGELGFEGVYEFIKKYCN